MNRLDISRINALAPYKVWEQEDGFNFETDFGLRYAIDFDDDANPYYTAYWFNLKNKNNATSPNDKKIEQTVVCVIDEFFRQNQNLEQTANFNFLNLLIPGYFFYKNL